MHSADILLVGYGKLNRQVGERLASMGKTVMAVRRSAAAKVIAMDASQPWHRTFTCQVVVVAVSADDRSVQGYQHSYLAVAQQLSAAIDCGKLQTKAVLWVSSTRVIASAVGQIDDQTSAEPEDQAGSVLAECEQVIHRLPCATVVARLTGIYGPERRWMLRQWRSGALHGDGTLTNRIEETDAARALVLLAQRLADGMQVPPVVLITDRESASRDEIARWLDQQLQPELPISKPVAVSGRIMTPRYLIATGFQWRYPSFRFGYLPLLNKFD